MIIPPHAVHALLAVVPIFKRDQLRELITLGVILALMTVAYYGFFDHAINSMGRGHVHDVNDQYLAHGLSEAKEVLNVLSAIKVPLSVLSTSSGGISFFVDVNVQLGQALKVLTDFVDHAWSFSLAAVMGLHALQIAHDLGQVSGTALLTIFFSVLGLAVSLRNVLPSIALALGRVAHLFLFVVLIAHFVVPLTIYGTAMAGHQFFHEHKTQVKAAYQQHLAKMPSESDGDGLHDQVQSTISHFKKNQSSTKQQADSFSVLTAKHSVLVLLELFLMPFVLFGALAWLSLAMTRFVREKGLL